MMAKKWREITIWNADGSYSGGMLATPQKEQELKDRGLFVTSGMADGDEYVLNPETGRKKKRQPTSPTITGNTIAGIPAGGRVMIEGRWVEPDDTGTIVLDPELGLPQDIELLIEHPLYQRTSVTVQCEALPAEQRTGKEVRIPQDEQRLRMSAYAEIGDGPQIDILAKAIADILSANPELDGPGIREAKALIAERTAIKERFPKATAVQAVSGGIGR